MPNLVVIIERVMTVMGNNEGHLLAIELDLQVFFLGLFGGSSQPLKHLDDFTPVNVVRCGVGKDLLESQLCVWHVLDSIAGHRPAQSIRLSGRAQS